MRPHFVLAATVALLQVVTAAVASPIHATTTTTTTGSSSTPALSKLWSFNPPGHCAEFSSGCGLRYHSGGPDYVVVTYNQRNSMCTLDATTGATLWCSTVARFGWKWQPWVVRSSADGTLSHFWTLYNGTQIAEVNPQTGDMTPLTTLNSQLKVTSGFLPNTALPLLTLTTGYTNGTKGSYLATVDLSKKKIVRTTTFPARAITKGDQQRSCTDATSQVLQPLTNNIGGTPTPSETVFVAEYCAGRSSFYYSYNVASGNLRSLFDGPNQGITQGPFQAYPSGYIIRETVNFTIGSIWEVYNATDKVYTFAQPGNVNVNKVLPFTVLTDAILGPVATSTTTAGAAVFSFVTGKEVWRSTQFAATLGNTRPTSYVPIFLNLLEEAPHCAVGSVCLSRLDTSDPALPVVWSNNVSTGYTKGELALAVPFPGFSDSYLYWVEFSVSTTTVSPKLSLVSTATGEVPATVDLLPASANVGDLAGMRTGACGASGCKNAFVVFGNILVAVGISQ